MTPTRVASILKIKVQAVYQWGEQVPVLRQYQLREWLTEREPETLARLQSASRQAKRRRNSVTASA